MAKAKKVAPQTESPQRAVAKVPEPPPETTLSYEWLPSGVPLITGVGDPDEIVAKAQEDFQISYLLGHWKKSKGAPTLVPSLFKSVKHLVGASVVRVEPKDALTVLAPMLAAQNNAEDTSQKVLGKLLGFLDNTKADKALEMLLETYYPNLSHAPTLEESGTFLLPEIPTTLVDDLEIFFRAVDKRYHIEGIAVLTYNPTFLDTDDPQQGWSVVIPKQHNSAGHCDYEMASIIEDKDDDAVVVGTAHSHPGMTAYCSHTDAKDQATQDGVHITFGWKHNSSITEYHPELQMAGVRWSLTPEQIFASWEPPVAVPDHVKAWVDEKVFKTTPQNKSTGYYSSNVAVDTKRSMLPTNTPPHTNAHVIIRVGQLRTHENCPSCNGKLIEQDYQNLRCGMCYVYFWPTSMGWDAYVDRVKKGTAAPNFDYQSSNPVLKPFKDIYLFEEEDGILKGHYLYKRENSGKA